MASLTHTMLLSASVLVAAFAAATPANAGGPEIAYAVESGTRFDLYLANADNTGRKKIYSSANKTNISQVDIRRGGNQLAILESSVAGGQGILKIINYSDAGVAQAPVTVSSPGCTVQGVDYSPADGSLIASRTCNNSDILEVRRYANNAWETDAIVSLDNSNRDHAIGGVRWLGDGSGFLWGTFDSNGGHIDRYMLSNPSATPITLYQATNIPNWFDVARCAAALDAGCSKLLVTDNTGGIHLVTFDDFGGTDQGVLYSSAADGHFSPDNAHVMWRHQVKGGYQLMVDNSVVLKATIAGKDWRQ